jgi:hypothetical protein
MLRQIQNGRFHSGEESVRRFDARILGVPNPLREKVAFGGLALAHLSH